MKYHRYRCMGPSFGWPYRYAVAWSGSPQPQARDDEISEQEPPGRNTWYSTREHARRRGHRAGNFGVRRPLRYLSYQLDLDEPQRRSIAAVLDRVKVEREQATLDEKKMMGQLADLIEQPEFSTDSLKETLSSRVRGAERLQKIIAKAIREIVEALDPDQREEFAYLVRTGAFRV